MRQLIWLMLALLVVAGGGEAQIRLGPGDRIAIDVLQRPDLNGEFMVAEDGSVSIHLMDRMPVGGLTVPEVEEDLTAKLNETLSTEVSVVVQATRLRDVYIFGDVATGGSFSYRPGLTVVQLLALAGGTSASGGQVSDIIPNEPAEVADLERQLADILAERARLDAEASGAPDLTFTEELNQLAGETLPELLAEQVAILETRRTEEAEFRLQLAEQRRLAEAEKETHAERLQVLTAQVEERTAEVERNEELRTRGLVTEERLGQLRANLRDDRSDLLSLTIAQSQTDRDIAALEASETGRAAEAARRRADRLATLAVRERDLRSRLRLAANVTLSEIALAEGATGLDRVSISVLRGSGSNISVTPGRLPSILQPGDVVEVRVLPLTGGLEQ